MDQVLSGLLSLSSVHFYSYAKEIQSVVIWGWDILTIAPNVNDISIKDMSNWIIWNDICMSYWIYFRFCYGTVDCMYSV